MHLTDENMLIKNDVSDMCALSVHVSLGYLFVQPHTNTFGSINQCRETFLCIYYWCTWL